MENTTKVTHFILLGLTNTTDLQIPLFVLFTLIYLITLTGNLGMMVLIMLDSRLHTPLYFFLSNLSFVDLCYSTTITPKVIAGFLIQDKVISYNACAAQLFFFVALATVENLLLASMAYDRYAAVCKPLHYTTIMTTSMCARLAVGPYIYGFLTASIYICNTFNLSFCKSNVVHQFFCDFPAVMALSCSDKHINNPVGHMENTTKVTHFILVGLTNSADLQIPLFVLFTLIYLITLTGNLGMMVLIMLDSRLHTPMYFFLSNLSFVDLCYSTTITPKVIAGFLIQDKVISYNACAAQLFFFVALATVENLLLASMAYDRYAAVCKPLHYTTTMTTNNPVGHMENTTKVTHFILVGLTNTADLQIPLFVLFTLIYLITLTGNLGMMVLIMLDSRLHTPMYFFLSNLSFVDLCYSTTITPKVIAGFLIQDKVISYNACAAQIFFFIALATMEIFLLASMAYDRYAAVCKPLHYTTTMTTSMCARLVIGPYIYGFLMYFQPSSNHSMDTDKIASVFYTMVIPMLNPVVYSLRNKEVKNAFKKVVEKTRLSGGLSF
ncbi:Olfactory receptor 5B2 [Tupaia chinensis]|uniref:Olfactory receptor 5B2 n=2 Tax=Tupaia chinensis TaxID=246437 RepID=L9JH98_TUPCH|nr:Olfactory receptor 5B2 [Tupaia chinensis]